MRSTSLKYHGIKNGSLDSVALDLGSSQKLKDQK